MIDPFRPTIAPPAQSVRSTTPYFRISVGFFPLALGFCVDLARSMDYGVNIVTQDDVVPPSYPILPKVLPWRGVNFCFSFFSSECAEVAAITDYAASDARGDDTACTEPTETSEATACRFCVACTSGGTLAGREELWGRFKFLMSE